MYAIAFDLDTESLKTSYPNESYANAYADIRKVLEAAGFSWRQGSVYFGDPDRVTAVSCVLVMQDLAERFSWFAACVRDVRMLRIEENNDLQPAIQAVTGGKE